jgi:long-chain acyl-CoA synthetase
MTETVSSIFKDTVARHGQRVAARHKVRGAWQPVTWASLGDQVHTVSAALVGLALPPKSRVGLMSNTRLDWVTADLGVLGAGCTTVPIYQSSIADDVQYIVNDANIECIFVEDASQVQKIASVRGQMPHLKHIICFDDCPEGEGVTQWADFMQRGRDVWAQRREEVEERGRGVSPSDLLTLVYTSGTTGRPKGVMITHDNMVYEATAIADIGLISPDDVQLLFLPLAHIFAKVLEITWIKLAHEMAFAESIALVVENMKDTRPTFMASVPRIFEKVHAKVVSKGTSAPGLKGKLARWAFKKEAEATVKELAGERAGGLGWKVAQRLVMSKVSASLAETFGGRLKFFVSGGAPLPADIAYFFKHNGVTILEGYGLTETSAATCVNLPHIVNIGTVGPALPGTEVKIAQDGEIMIKGRGVFQGYWNRPDATAEAIEPDGWFHSGDLGSLDARGILKITGRKKDIIVTAGGKNVAPQNIESKLKSACGIISQVVLHGDKRKFLSALVTLDEAALKEWASARGLSGSYAELTQHKDVFAEVKATFDEVNNALASYETVKKFKVLSADFSVESGELTPSLKVKRNVVFANYKALYDAFYEGGGGGGDH